MPGKLFGNIIFIIGIVIAVSGVIFIIVAFISRAEVISNMEDEEVKTEIDGKEVMVNDARTAMIQANLIKQHSLDRYGTYSSMERDDPNRTIYIHGLTLRNSLIIARMALNLTLLIMGIGGLLILSGASFGVLGLQMAKQKKQA